MEETLKQQSSSIIKVVLFGPESTGKTTLSEQLARYYSTVWVPEYAREYRRINGMKKEKHVSYMTLSQ